MGLIATIPLFFAWWAYVDLSGGIYNHGAYKEVDLKAMSTFDMDQFNGTETDIPERFRGLEGQQIMAVGEMWAPRSAGDGKLGYFVLVYSRTKCCFNGPPLAQHFVDGNVVPGKHVYYYESPVRVWGRLHVFIDKDPATGKIKSVYHIDVDKVEPIES